MSFFIHPHLRDGHTEYELLLVKNPLSFPTPVSAPYHISPARLGERKIRPPRPAAVILVLSAFL